MGTQSSVMHMGTEDQSHTRATVSQIEKVTVHRCLLHMGFIAADQSDCPY